jgi:hypothetical protein
MYSSIHNSCHASFGVGGVAQIQGRISKLEESWQFVGLYDRRVEVRFPDKWFLSSTKRPERLYGPPILPFNVNSEKIGQNVKSAEDENAQLYLPSPACLHGVVLN